MKTPICKLCKSPHWTYEEHKITESSVPEYVQEMAKGALSRQESPRPAAPQAQGSGDGQGATGAQKAGEATEITTTESRRPPMTVTQETCNTCNKPFNNRGKVCNACRQKAYRERSK